MAAYNTVRLDKSLYKNTAGFSGALEQLDPSKSYQGTELAGLDAFQRQLKRFDIKVSGPASDSLAKFFATTDSAALFPEYVARAVSQGTQDSDILAKMLAARTEINSMDYRSIHSSCDTAGMEAPVEEGGLLPMSSISLKDNLVKLKKYGRMLCASYEAIRFQRIDVFTVALRQIGDGIAKAQLKAAVQVLEQGDGNQNPAQVLETAAAGTLTYNDLLELWGAFADFEMNTLLVAPDMMRKMLTLKEFQDPATGLNFQGTGALSTPMGATLLKCSAVKPGQIVALDKRFALEMVTAGGVQVEYDKLIDTQLERAAITSIAGFSKLFPDAVKILALKK